MNKLKMTIVMMIGIFFMVGMLGTACAQGSNFSVKADTIEYDMQSGDGMALSLIHISEPTRPY